MTRFARAKGSKASNEKKEEEPTSWLEMKQGLLSKKSKGPPADSNPTEEVKRVDPPKATKWASLGDDPPLLLEHHRNKQQGETEEIKKMGKLKKKRENSVSDDNKLEKKKKKKKKRKLESSETNNSDKADLSVEESKKNKKRKFSKVEADDLKEPTIKKKKKEVNSELKEKKLEKAKNKVEKKMKKNKNCETLDKSKQSVKDKKNCFNNKVREKKFEKSSKQKFKDKRKFLHDKNYVPNKFVPEEIIVNGEKIQVVKFQGFNVTLEEAERLRKLRTDLINQGVPKSEIEAIIKLERRRAEKALSRLKKSVCFHCRGSGHLLSNCPDLAQREDTSTGICYKCGSTEHSALECKVVRGTNYQFAECFICKEQGHIARQCPDNPRGLYPQGGACRECGDVTHLRKDCPQVMSQKSEEIITVGLRNDRNLECLEEEIVNKEKQKPKQEKRKKSAVKF